MQTFIRWPSSSWMCGEIKVVQMRFYLPGHAIILGQCIKDWIASMKFKLKFVECATSQNQYNKKRVNNKMNDGRRTEKKWKQDSEWHIEVIVGDMLSLYTYMCPMVIFCQFHFHFFSIMCRITDKMYSAHTQWRGAREIPKATKRWGKPKTA